MVYYEDIVIDNNGKTACELCKIFIGDSTSCIENHVNDKNHARLYMKKMILENSIRISGQQMDCEICEQMFDPGNVVTHIQGPVHKERLNSLKSIITKDGGFIVQPDANTNLGSAVNCLVCNHTMEFTIKSIESHIASKIHKIARSIAVQPLNGIFSVEDSKDDLWCKICQVYFENYVEVINEHVDEDPKHVKEIRQLFLLIQGQSIDIEKFLYDPKEDKASCKKCDIEVACNLDNLERHIKGKKHTFYMKGSS